jgi:hypothetical protein
MKNTLKAIAREQMNPWYSCIGAGLWARVMHHVCDDTIRCAAITSLGDHDDMDDPSSDEGYSSCHSLERHLGRLMELDDCVKAATNGNLFLDLAKQVGDIINSEASRIHALRRERKLRKPDDRYVPPGPTLRGRYCYRMMDIEVSAWLAREYLQDHDSFGSPVSYCLDRADDKAGGDLLDETVVPMRVYVLDALCLMRMHRAYVARNYTEPSCMRFVRVQSQLPAKQSPVPLP